MYDLQDIPESRSFHDARKAQNIEGTHETENVSSRARECKHDNVCKYVRMYACMYVYYLAYECI